MSLETEMLKLPWSNSGKESLKETSSSRPQILLKKLLTAKQGIEHVNIVFVDILQQSVWTYFFIYIM